MKKLLISALGGSLFPYLHDQLKDKYELFYVDSNIYLKHVYPTCNFVITPNVTDASYFDIVKEIIKNNNIDYYLPLIDEEIIGAKAIEGYNNVRVIAPSIPFCERSMNKFNLMKELASNNISSIKSYIGDNFTYLPNNIYFVKPITGRGSRGIKKIDSKEQLDAYYVLEGYKPEEILIQEYVKGTEYSVGVTVNNLNQILLVGVRKIISKKGITRIAITEQNQIIYEAVEHIVNSLKPNGSINVQLFLTEDNEVKIFEINPRFSTTTIMNYAGGIDEISLLIEYLDKEYKGEVLQPKDNVVLYRRWESVLYDK